MKYKSVLKLMHPAPIERSSCDRITRPRLVAGAFNGVSRFTTALSVAPLSR